VTLTTAEEGKELMVAEDHYNMEQQEQYSQAEHQPDDR
jgi:hypothetical protein